MAYTWQWTMIVYGHSNFCHCFDSMWDKHMSSLAWDEITYSFPNFNSATVEVWEWISNFNWHFMMDVITYPCQDLS